MLPERRDFAQMWRFLEKYCAAGPVVSSVDHLLRQMNRGQSSAFTYGRAMVCLKVMDDRGLIRVSLSGQDATVELHNTAQKVDLEQAAMMRLLRKLLEET